MKKAKLFLLIVSYVFVILVLALVTYVSSEAWVSYLTAASALITLLNFGSHLFDNQRN